MPTNEYFMANDSDLTLHLKELFNEYVGLYTKLFNEGGEIAGLPDERIEMAIKLESAIQEMSQVVMEMQTHQSEIELVADVAPQTISAAKRSSLASHVS
jgi:hypothetical protein